MSHTILQYGSVVTTQKIVDGSTAHLVTEYHQSQFVKDEQQALAEFLVLLDRHKSGEIDDFGMACHFTNGKLRLEKSWKVES
jgi:hypothetical protein